MDQGGPQLAELRDWHDQPRGPDGKFAGGGGAKTAAEAEWIAKGEAAWAAHKTAWGKHVAAKAAGKPSLASYYKKQATQHAEKAALFKAQAMKASVAAKAEAPKAEVPKVAHETVGAVDPEHAKLLAKHEAAKAAGKPSLASYYKKKAAEHKAHADKMKAQGEAAKAKAEADAAKAKAAADAKAAQATKAQAASDAKLAELVKKHEAAKAAGKPSLASYYKKKVAAHKAAHQPASPPPSAAPLPGDTVTTNGKPSDQFSGHYLEASHAPVDVKAFVSAQTDNPVAGTHAGLAHSPANATHLSGATKQAVVSYTGAGYTNMNNALRGNSPMTPAMKAKIKAMDEAFKPLGKSMVVYRNTGNLHTFDGLKPGDIISDAGYHSTSIRKGVFASSYKSRMEIILPKGTKASWVQPISSHPSEDEMVLPRGQKYVVLAGTTTADGKPVLRLMAIPDDLLPGISTKAAHPGKPHQHDLRAVLFALAAQTLDEIRRTTQ